jgi:methyl-accepting chemotaxis protein
MVLKVNKDKVPVSGIEIGRRGIGIRGVVPINNNGVHAGSFEIAMEFKPVLNNLKKLTGYDTAVFIDEERMSKIATLIPTPDPEKIIGGMRVQESTNWRLLRGLTNPDIINSTKEALTEKKFYDGEDYSLIIAPLVDYKGQQIGLIVAAKSLKYTDDLKYSLFWNNIFLAFGQALVVTAFASVFFNGLLLRPILSLGRNIKDISENTHVSDSSPNSLDPLLNRRDEVGEIARDCKELQIRISDYNQGNHTSS